MIQTMKWSSSFSIFLRCISLAAKFIFMLALAKLTNPATIGIYALIVTIITILVYVIGAEIHTYTTREVVNPKNEWAKNDHIKNHLLFVLSGTLASAPIAWLVLKFLHIGHSISFSAFLLILSGEVICQELARYLLIFSKPILSNILQLIRSAAWMPAAIILLKIYPPSINHILISWATGSLLAGVFGIWHLRENLTKRINFKLSWFNKAFLSSRYYFAVALLAQIQSYADRFITQIALGEKQVGLLSFYQSFANTTQTFVQTGIISILLPQLLIFTQNKNWLETKRIRNKMLFSSSGLALAIAIVLFVGMPNVLRYLKHSEYTNTFYLFPWLLLGNIIVIIGTVAHLQLYALKKDRTLMNISLIIVPLSILANAIIIPRIGIDGAVAVFIISSGAQTSIKILLNRIIINKLYINHQHQTI